MHRPVIEHLPRVHKAVSFIPSITRGNIKEKDFWNVWLMISHLFIVFWWSFYRRRMLDLESPLSVYLLSYRPFVNLFCFYGDHTPPISFNPSIFQSPLLSSGYPTPLSLFRGTIIISFNILWQHCFILHFATFSFQMNPSHIGFFFLDAILKCLALLGLCHC